MSPLRAQLVANDPASVFTILKRLCSKVSPRKVDPTSLSVNLSIRLLQRFSFQRCCADLLLLGLLLFITSHADAVPTVWITAPYSDTTYTAPVSVTINANASEYAYQGGSIAKVEFFNGSTLLGTDTVAPYSYTWSNAPAGSHTLTAKATSTLGVSGTSSPVTITVLENPAPTVALTAPSNNASYFAPASIALSATASDSNGSIAKVEFFNGSTLLGADTIAPYSYTWSNVPAGSYTVTAKATDNGGSVTTSAPIAITVVTNAAPTVALTAPSNNAAYAAPASSIALSAAASDSDGSIAKVQFFNGSTLLGTDFSAPYTHNWLNVPAGNYTVTAKATDNGGSVVTSSPVTITVSVNTAPTVALTAPTNNATYAAPASIALSAAASDGDGSIAKVEFFNGSTLLWEDTVAPYTYTWNNVAPGSYTIKARATDNLGGVSAFSSDINVTVTGAAYQAPGAATSNAPPGTTPGVFQVSQTGSATYSIPIQVSPGTAGMAPALTLNYNSGAGNGLLGVGWSLGGLSAITRCPQTLAQDNNRGSVNFDNNDRFCLDGQRLVAVAGAYGANGTEYRTELESFSKIISYNNNTSGNGPTWFKVWTKAGQIIEYGNTADSRVEAQGQSSVLVWAANKIQDRKGNYLTITYTETNANGEYYPNRIDYTGNASAGLATYNSVGFDYASRDDIEIAYVGASKVSNTKRLTNIKVYSGTSVVRNYQLAYQYGTGSGRSRLVSLTECDSLLICLPATTFAWQDSTVSFAIAGNATTGFTDAGGWNDGLRYFVMDVNGDGKGDIVSRDAAGNLLTFLSNGGTYVYGGSTATGYSDASGWNSGLRYFVMDVNGDGKGDIVARDGAGNLLTWLSNGTTFTYAGSTTTGFTDAGGWNSGLRYFVMDVNGDGKGDIVSRDATGNLLTLLSNGTMFVYGGSTATGYSDADGWNSGMRFFTMDVNGDGKGDIVARNSAGTLLTWLSNGVTFAYATSTAAILDDAEYGEGLHFFVMDVNGDGKTDLVSRDDFGNLKPWISKGAGFIGGDNVSSGQTDSAGGDVGLHYFPMDVNGDGKMDMVVRNSAGGFSIYRSIGTKFIPGGYFNTSFNDSSGWNAGLRYFITDVNGDGKGDIVARYSDGTLSTLQFSSLQAADLVSSITNGLGAAISVNYKPLTDSAVYSKGTGAIYPVVDVQTPAQVVAETQSDNGIGGKYRMTYRYFGAKMDQSGRGALGFSWMEASDPQNGITTRTTFRQDYPYIGLAQQVSSWTSVGLREVVNTFAATSLGGTRYFPFLSQSREKKWDLNGAFLSWSTINNQYDSYGNATQVSATTSNSAGTPDGYGKTLTTTFSNDVVNWLLGRPTNTTLVSTMPGGVSQTRTVAYVSYDAEGLLKQEIVEPNNTALKFIANYGYDAFGNRTSTAFSSAVNSAVSPNILSRTSSVSFDAQGRFPIRFINAMGHSEDRVFDAKLGTLTRLTDSNGLVNSWTYDSFGRRLTEALPDGTQTTWAYAKCINCWNESRYYVSSKKTLISGGAVISPLTKVYYDSLGRKLLSQTAGFDGTDVYQEIEYDSRGRVMRESHPRFAGNSTYWTNFVYDDLNRFVRRTAADGAITNFSYNGLTSSETNAKGQVITQVRNSQGQVISVTTAAGTAAASSITYAYDPFGNLARSTDAAGNVTQMTYDLRGRKISMSDPDLGSWTYGYNVLGELTSETTARNQVTTLTYDKLGRVVARNAPDYNSSWTYDSCTKGIGKLCQATATNGYSRTHSYDSLGRPISISTSIDAAYVASVTYDAANRPETVTYPTGFALRYVYNGRGYLAEVRNNATGAKYWQASAVNASGQVTGDQLGNGINTIRDFDSANGRLTKTTAGVGDGVQNHSYSYDSLGNLVGRTDGNLNLVENYGYDALNRLVSSSGTGLPSKTIAYNAIGNITSKSGVGTYSYGAKPHALASVTGTVNGVVNPAFSYDANGNLLSGAGRTMTWTAFNMPATVAKGAVSLSFNYGPEHQRIRQISPTSTTIYLFSPHYEKETKNSGLVEHKHYLYAGNKMIGLYTQRSDGVSQTRYFHDDHLGSTNAISNESGTVVERLNYDAWGKRRNTNGSDDPNNILRPSIDRGYTGHEHLDEGGLGLVHMNGRVYDPLIGRFASADPLVQAPAYSESFNRYSYVWNNPLKYTDPSGFEVTYGAWHIDSEGSMTRSGFDSATGAMVVQGCVTNLCDKAVSDGMLGQVTASATGSAGSSETLSNYPTSLSYSGIMNGVSYGGGSGTTSGSSMTQSTTTTSNSGSTTISTTVTFTNTTGGCGTTCTVSGVTVGGTDSGTATGGNSPAVSSTANGIMGGGGTSSMLAGGNPASMNGANVLKELPRDIFMSPDKFYRHYVGFPVTDGAGISAVSKPNGGAVRFANNFGLAKYPYPCMLCEGQSFSAFMNELPLINSIAGIHDVMNQGLSDGVFAITNVPTMFIAAGMTYQAWTFAKAREAINYITKPFCSSHQLSC